MKHHRIRRPVVPTRRNHRSRHTPRRLSNLTAQSKRFSSTNNKTKIILTTPSTQTPTPPHTQPQTQPLGLNTTTKRSNIKRTRSNPAPIINKRRRQQPKQQHRLVRLSLTNHTRSRRTKRQHQNQRKPNTEHRVQNNQLLADPHPRKQTPRTNTSNPNTPNRLSNPTTTHHAITNPYTNSRPVPFRTITRTPTNLQTSQNTLHARILPPTG